VISHVAIVLPARNEADRIGDALDALIRARLALPERVTSAVLVVVDHSEDATARIARSTLRGTLDRVIETDARSVGAARMVGAAHALATSPARPARTWLASTDADSVVPADWLLRHLEGADAGAVALAGVVRLRDDETTDDTLRHRFAATYGEELADGHAHIHGANLGARGDAYLLAGGWRPLERSEDHDLWHRLARCGPVRSLASLVVATSARPVGRAPQGFAADIAELARHDGVVA
jgi:glycosyltransferase involved in cell wall biosynthesis